MDRDPGPQRPGAMGPWRARLVSPPARHGARGTALSPSVASRDPTAPRLQGVGPAASPRPAIRPRRDPPPPEPKVPRGLEGPTQGGIQPGRGAPSRGGFVPWGAGPARSMTADPRVSLPGLPGRPPGPGTEGPRGTPVPRPPRHGPSPTRLPAEGAGEAHQRDPRARAPSYWRRDRFCIVQGGRHPTPRPSRRARTPWASGHAGPEAPSALSGRGGLGRVRRGMRGPRVRRRAPSPPSEGALTPRGVGVRRFGPRRRPRGRHVRRTEPTRHGFGCLDSPPRPVPNLRGGAASVEAASRTRRGEGWDPSVRTPTPVEGGRGASPRGPRVASPGGLTGPTVRGRSACTDRPRGG